MCGWNDQYVALDYGYEGGVIWKEHGALKWEGEIG